MDWVAEQAAAWTRCGVQLAVAVDMWHHTTIPTTASQAQQRLQEQSYIQHTAAGASVYAPQFAADAVLQVLLATLLLNHTALHVLHPAHELAAAAAECLLLLVNLAALTWHLQEGLLLAAAPKLLVLAVVTRLGPPVLLGLLTAASRGSSSSSSIAWASMDRTLSSNSNSGSSSSGRSGYSASEIGHQAAATGAEQFAGNPLSHHHEFENVQGLTT
uniref:Uncharacterized protein n=1 Tax=Tetradesmus obliquus TaxID=3088 RepID=A0A383V6I3_TETOB|eukprot:jgi/Sobl393_1/6215/SZX59956.1